MNTSKSVHWSQIQKLTLAISIALMAGSGVVLTSCSGSEGTFTQVVPETEAALAVFAYYEEAGIRKVARIDPETLEVLETKENPINASGGKQKSYFYEDGYVWGVASSSVFALNPETLEPILGTTGRYIQGNRSGNVGPGLVNSVGVAVQSVSTQSVSTQDVVFDKDLARLLQGDWTNKMLEEVDYCALRSKASQAMTTLVQWGGVTTQALSTQALTADAVRIHNIGYGNVGNENSPDGKLLMIAVRQGDHILYVDTDPNSTTFGKPVRMIYPRYGTVKDQNNSVVGRFASAYTAGGGTALGNHRWSRATDAASAVANETDRETYVEPCDSTMLRNHAGQVWSWTVDVDGDTLTGVNVDKINTSAPEVYNIKVPVVLQRNFQSNRASAGPWMASLVNRNLGANEFLLFVEYEGENAEGVWNITNAAVPVEVQRVYINLMDVVDTPPVSFVNGAAYNVSVKFSSTGGANTIVSYRYVALPGNDGTGSSPLGVGTTGYLQKVSAAAPGPGFLLNGLTTRALTSLGTMSRTTGTGALTTVYSDEVWLDNQTATGWDIMNLRTNLPWLITEKLALRSNPGHWVKDRYFQVVDGVVQVIDRTTRGIVKEIRIGNGVVSALAVGTYKRPKTVTGGGTSSGGGSTGGGGGGRPPVNPCGG